MYQWKAGELITADKLSPKVLGGREYLEFTIPESDYWRASVNVTFPAGYFTETPYVVVTPNTSVPGNFLGCGVLNTSKDGFVLYGARRGTTRTSVFWIAMQIDGM